MRIWQAESMVKFLMVTKNTPTGAADSQVEGAGRSGRQVTASRDKDILSSSVSTSLESSVIRSDNAQSSNPNDPDWDRRKPSRVPPPEPKKPPVELPRYRFLSKLPGPNNFAYRAFLLSFLCTQLPILLVLVYVILNVEMTADMLTIVSIVLITALLGAASTLVVLMVYNEPLEALSRAVKEYDAEDFVSSLPEVTGTDEIGQLMANTQGALKKLHGILYSMHEQSIRDEMTGLYNRRFFVEQAEMMLARAIRFEEPLSLIFIDIDRFKEINDNFSHRVGDQTIKVIAELITSSSRSTDLASRLGGDEFVIVYPKTSLKQAVRLCERLRNAVESYDWSTLLPGDRITLSMGVAKSMEMDMIEAMMDRADANLRQAKHQGGNQVVS